MISIQKTVRISGSKKLIYSCIFYVAQDGTLLTGPGLPRRVIYNTYSSWSKWLHHGLRSTARTAAYSSCRLAYRGRNYRAYRRFPSTTIPTTAMRSAYTDLNNASEQTGRNATETTKGQNSNIFSTSIIVYTLQTAFRELAGIHRWFARHLGSDTVG